MHPCAQCAGLGPTCCERSEVLVTRGDIGRIETHVGRNGFWERKRVGDQSILDQPDDLRFVQWGFDEQGARRVLKRRENGACTFLSVHGCTLPGHVRPLICRLYPFRYTEGGLDGSDAHCPTELVPPGRTILQVLDVRRVEAETWHRQLYHELQTEWQQHAHRDDL